MDSHFRSSSGLTTVSSTELKICVHVFEQFLSLEAFVICHTCMFTASSLTTVHLDKTILYVFF